jgi:small neutral amino acid transporter SnatA (MarC family)
MRPRARLLRGALLAGLLVVLAFGVAAPPERCPSVSSAELRSSAAAAVGWFARNQEPDGRWLYEYDRSDDSASAGYNPVRHSGVTMSLYQAAGEGIPGAMGSADRGLAWALDHLTHEGKWSAVEYNGEVETGASALLATALVNRRDLTGDARYDRVLQRLGRFLVLQTEPSGAVSAAYDDEREEPVRGDYSKYFTGEAYMALARLHLAFPGEDWGEAADRIGRYLATERDDAEEHWPPVPDHWAAYGMALTAEFPEREASGLDGDEVSYARRQAEMFGASTRWVSQQAGPWGELVRGGNFPRGGGYGVMDEALTGWWRAARIEPGLAAYEDPLADRASCVAGLALREQSDEDDAAGAERPGRVAGAWFDGDVTRMDDQQHALSGLLMTLPIAEAGVPGSGSGAGEPSAWLWALVLILALNPARAAFGIPRRGSRREAVELAALGGAAGGLAVCVVAALGPALLDALNVSDPSFRAAAGIVAVLVGAIDIFRRPPGPEPALEGGRAALMPVAFPVVARPVLVVLALGAGADQGVLLTAAAMVAGVGMLAALTAWCDPEDRHRRVLRWAGRLLAAGLIAGGVVLAVDGVLDV